MSDHVVEPVPLPAEGSPAAAQQLQYVTAGTDAYVAGPSARGVLIALLGGLVAATLSAAIALGWIILRLPSPFFFPLILQGFLLGIALLWLFQRFRMRGAAAGIVIGLTCGLLSIVLFYYGVYVRDVMSTRAAWLDEIAHQQTDGTSMVNPAVTAYVRAHPFAAFDQFAMGPSGRHGFVGYMVMRLPKIGHIAVIQLLAVTILPTMFGKFAGSRPVCDDCQTVLNEGVTVATFPSEVMEELRAALLANDAERVLALHQRDRYGGAWLARVQLRYCARCDIRYVEIVTGTARATPPDTARVRVSKQTLDALRWEPSESETQIAERVDEVNASDEASADRPAEG